MVKMGGSALWLVFPLVVCGCEFLAPAPKVPERVRVARDFWGIARAECIEREPWNVCFVRVKVSENPEHAKAAKAFAGIALGFCADGERWDTCVWRLENIDDTKPKK